MKPRPELTPEQAEAAEAKRLARQAKKASQPAKPAFSWPEQPFLARELYRFRPASGSASLSIATWNVLAQALIRRTLFPGCDALRWSQRSALLSQVLHYTPSLLCLQEVDRIDDHASFLRHAGYHWVYEKGYKNKQHGLLVAWKEKEFELEKSDWAKLDDLRLGDRSGASRKTRNIGLCVALRRKRDQSGIILATHHLFWHPCYIYERSRQLALWLHHISIFRQSLPKERGWSVALAGDFNIQPTELGYWLMCAPQRQPPQSMVDVWQRSQVVHESVDPTKASAQAVEQEAEEDQEEEEEEEDADRVFQNCRSPTPADGLLSIDELRSLFQTLSPSGGTSIYDSTSVPGAETFGGRSSDILPRDSKDERWPGDSEPVYTNVTPLWRCTLDYIVLYPAKEEVGEMQVDAVLQMPKTEALEPGLPRLGISASDHLLLMGEVSGL